MSCDQDHLRVRQQLLGSIENLQAVDLVHDQVGNDQIERPLLEFLQAFRTARGDGRLVSNALQAFSHGFRMRHVVIDDEHGNRRSF
jgi:hypothetical protein